MTSDLSKLDRPSPRTLAKRLREEFANWYVLGPLAWLALPSRLPPAGGIESLAGRRIVVRLRDGRRAECRLDEFFSFVEVFVLREYDHPGIDWSNVRTVVDVGANVGAATLWFARRSRQAAIVAVEPAPESLVTLEANLRTNGLGNRVRVVPAALSGRTGSVFLTRNGSSVYAQTAGVPSPGAERVQAVALPELLELCELGQVDVLKLDCEGAEFDGLLACDEPLLRRVGAIVGEYHGDGHDLTYLAQHLERAGFATEFQGTAELGLFAALRRDA
jgi:FkbM family methyltransferase